jgi:hypothetical protein
MLVIQVAELASTPLARRHFVRARRSYRSSAANLRRARGSKLSEIRPDIKPFRTSRIRLSSNCDRANAVVCRLSPSTPRATARAMASIIANVIRSSGNGPDNPCRNALRLERRFPAVVFGPVLFFELARFAAICLSVAISTTSPISPKRSQISADSCVPMADCHWRGQRVGAL